MTMSLTTNQSELNSMIRVGVKNYRKWECHTGHVVCIQMNAYRIISGSRSENFLWSIIYQNHVYTRDRSLMLNDFWLKTISALKPKEQENQKNSRFLNRPIFNL